ncbi:MAG: DUF4136 domain-containing protein [Candidatus Acidiferrales bacterium]
MRSLKMLLGLLLLFGIAITVEAQKVSIDYDHQANFSDYKTFSWIRPPHFQADPLMDQRIIDSVNAALTSKGWQFVPEGGDVGIAAHVATREDHTLETFYTGFGGGWGWHFGTGFGTALTTDHAYEVGTIIIDMFDSRTKQLVWRGLATEALSEKPEKDTKKVEKAIDKLFKNFPPTR